MYTYVIGFFSIIICYINCELIRKILTIYLCEICFRESRKRKDTSKPEGTTSIPLI